MDAGLAAVLGATVGAIGTGGAGIVAALLSRSQSRMQIQAEHARFIREPRKAAYAAYAEAAQLEHQRLGDAEAVLDVFAGMNDTDLQVQRAVAILTQSDEARHLLRHLRAQVYIEGPRSVLSAAVDLSSALTDYKSVVRRRLHAMQTGDQQSAPSPSPDPRQTAYERYLDFLYAASDAVGADGFSELPER